MNPQPYTTVPAPSPPKDKRTADCEHGWHGLACRIAGCSCPSSWRDPRVDEVAS